MVRVWVNICVPPDDVPMFSVISQPNVRHLRTYSLFTMVLIDCSAPALLRRRRSEALAGLPEVVLQLVMFDVKVPFVIKLDGINTKVFTMFTILKWSGLIFIAIKLTQ